MAEREGFEPSVLSHTAFRERHHQPLGHLSVKEDTARRLPGFLVPGSASAGNALAQLGGFGLHDPGHYADPPAECFAG